MSLEGSATAARAEKPGHESSLDCEERAARWHRAADEAIEVVDSLGPEFERDTTRLADLRAQLRSGRFNLAVLGQFKRGKSSLVNALLGEELLPTGLTPLTAIPTFVEFGPDYTVRVEHLEGGGDLFSLGDVKEAHDLLARFVSEGSNPENRLALARVRVTSRSPLLRDGLTLIDTPGIGSTFRHNTETTLNFLPECDAALLVVSADPPLTETEVGFLREVRKKINLVYFVLNKADYLDSGERHEATAFLQRTLASELGVVEQFRVFPVSAKEGWRARVRGDMEALSSSGIRDLEHDIFEPLVREKNSVLLRSLSSRALGQVQEIAFRVAVMVKASRMPLQDLESRLATFRMRLEEAQEQRRMLNDLFVGDEARSRSFLGTQVDELTRKALNRLRTVCEAALVEQEDETLVMDAVSNAIPPFFEREFGEATRVVKERVQEAVSSHERRARELLDGVRKMTSQLFDVDYVSGPAPESVELNAKPYWVTHSWDAVLQPIPSEVLDRFFPAKIRSARIRARLSERIERLVVRNVENLRWAILSSLKESYAVSAQHLDAELAQGMDSIRNAIEVNLARRQTCAASAEEDERRLDAAQASLRECSGEFQELTSID